MATGIWEIRREVTTLVSFPSRLFLTNLFFSPIYYHGKFARCITIPIRLSLVSLHVYIYVYYHGSFFGRMILVLECDCLRCWASASCSMDYFACNKSILEFLSVLVGCHHFHSILVLSFDANMGAFYLSAVCVWTKMICQTVWSN